MATKTKPMGIRNNNPGNLRDTVTPDIRAKHVAGYAVFETMDEGLQEIFSLIHIYYETHGLKTVFDFISRYAPASENDVNAYIMFVARRLGVRLGAERTEDLRLNQVWRQIDLARAIIIIECGWAPSTEVASPEWFTPQQLFKALCETRGWDDESNGHQSAEGGEQHGQ